jgi:hypothetical protein
MIGRRLVIRVVADSCELDRFPIVFDVQTMALQQHRSEQWILPIVGHDLRLVGFAEPIEETRKRFQLDATLVGRFRMYG